MKIRKENYLLLQTKKTIKDPLLNLWLPFKNCVITRSSLEVGKDLKVSNVYFFNFCDRNLLTNNISL